MNKVEKIVDIITNGVSLFTEKGLIKTYRQRTHELAKYLNGILTEEEIKEIILSVDGKRVDKCNYDFVLFKKLLHIAAKEPELADEIYDIFLSLNFGFTSFKKHVNKLSLKQLNNPLIHKICFELADVNYRKLDEKTKKKILKSIPFDKLMEDIYFSFARDEDKFYIIYELHPTDMANYIKERLNNCNFRFLEYYRRGCFMQKFITKYCIEYALKYHKDKLEDIIMDNYQLFIETIKEIENIPVESIEIIKDLTLSNKQFKLFFETSIKNEYLFTEFFDPDDINKVISIFGKNYTYNYLRKLNCKLINEEMINEVINECKGNFFQYYLDNQMHISYLTYYLQNLKQIDIEDYLLIKKNGNMYDKYVMDEFYSKVDPLVLYTYAVNGLVEIDIYPVIQEYVEKETDENVINKLINSSNISDGAKSRIISEKYGKMHIMIEPQNVSFLTGIAFKYDISKFVDMDKVYEFYKNNNFKLIDNQTDRIFYMFSVEFFPRLRNENISKIYEIINNSDSQNIKTFLLKEFKDKIDFNNINLDKIDLNLLFEMYSSEEIITKFNKKFIIESLIKINNVELFNKYESYIINCDISNVMDIIIKTKCSDDIKYNVLIKYRDKLDLQIDDKILLSNQCKKIFLIFKDDLLNYWKKYGNYEEFIKFDEQNFIDLISEIYDKNDITFVFEYIKNEFNIKYIDKIIELFNRLDINKKYIIKYGLGLTDIPWPKIIYNSNIEEFTMLLDYMQKNYYKNENKDSVIYYNNLFDFIKNYEQNKTLISSLKTSGKPLTAEDINAIKFTFMNNFKVKNLDECNSMYKRKMNELSKIDKRFLKNEESIKKIISNILFGIDYEKVQEYLKTYGTVVDLKIMGFNNRFTENFDHTLLTKIIGLTSMLESIESCHDIDRLQKLLKNIIKNNEHCLKLNAYFASYPELMRQLYEKESQVSLTKIDMLDEKYLLKEKTDEYKVPVYDLSTSAYILLAHCVSYSDRIEKLITGEDIKYGCICVSAVSYRNQKYYSINDKIIFGFSNLPEGSYIYGSLENMSSNGSHQKGTGKVEDLSRKQRDIRNISDARYSINSEILLFRENLKPSCIIIPGDRFPTEDELTICQKYNLPIVYTQKVEESIKNPQPIVGQEVTIQRDFDLGPQMLCDEIKSLNKSKNRKIAIMADAHGLYEPTLAILEDMRKKGIDEIYSLGDNIGFGPNSSEVMDLLKAYNVKSVLGNHEQYVLDVDKYEKHLTDTGAYESTITEVDRLKEVLTPDQIAEIEQMPKFIELTFKNKKMLLCHYTKGYNSGKDAVKNKDEYEIIFQGHKHQEAREKNIKTLRATGFNHSNSYSKASYIIIEETKRGYRVQTVEVPYNTYNLRSSIEYSELNDEEKEKMNVWTGVTRK